MEHSPPDPAIFWSLAQSGLVKTPIFQVLTGRVLTASFLNCCLSNQPSVLTMILPFGTLTGLGTPLTLGATKNKELGETTRSLDCTDPQGSSPTQDSSVKRGRGGCFI